jgi:hypothetical protein
MFVNVRGQAGIGSRTDCVMSCFPRGDDRSLPAVPRQVYETMVHHQRTNVANCPPNDPVMIIDHTEKQDFQFRGRRDEDNATMTR